MRVMMMILRGGEGCNDDIGAGGNGEVSHNNDEGHYARRRR